MMLFRVHSNPLCQEAAGIVSSGTCRNLGEQLYQCNHLYNERYYSYPTCIRRTMWGSDLMKERACFLFLFKLAAVSESESEYLLSQYKFTGKFVLRCTGYKFTGTSLRCTVTINNRLINTATKAQKDTQHTQRIIITALKK